MKIRKRESGRSMIEIIGVLAISGLLTVAAFVLIQSGMESQKRNRAGDEINVLVQNVRALTAEADNFDKLGGDVVSDDHGAGVRPNPPAAASIQAKYAKAILQSDGTTPFDENSYYAVSGSGKYFTIWLVKIGSEECETMAMRSYTGSVHVTCESNNKPAWFAITYAK